MKRILAKLLICAMILLPTTAFAAAFPSTPIIDTFDRTNEAAIASPWLLTDNPSHILPALISNQVDSISGSDNGIYWSTTQFGADQESYFQFTAGDNYVLATVRNQDVGTTNADWYGCGPRSLTGDWAIYKYRNSSYTQLGSDIVSAHDAGDWVGCKVVGSTITMWKKVAGVWSLLDTQTDTDITGPGYIGITSASTANNTMDNFGGGVVLISIGPMMGTF